MKIKLIWRQEARLDDFFMAQTCWWRRGKLGEWADRHF